MIHRSEQRGADYSKTWQTDEHLFQTKCPFPFSQSQKSWMNEAPRSLGAEKQHNRGGYTCGEWKSVHGYYAGNLIAALCEISINWGYLNVAFRRMWVISLHAVDPHMCIEDSVKGWKGFPWLWWWREHRQDEKKNVTSPTSLGGENKG